LVQDVEVRGNPLTGEPRSMIVKSCFGRFDKPDPDATVAATDQLKARLAAFRAATGK
jgi:hypothetical protein